MNRDPMAVLRLAASMAECGVPQAEVDEAISQVEALVADMRKVKLAALLGRRYHTTGPGYYEEIEQLALAALAPFAPGQDSEGAA